MDQDTDALLREILCEYLDILPEELSPGGWATDALAGGELEPGEVAAQGGDRRGPAPQLVPLVRSRLTPARARGQLVRAGALSPYETRLIVEDALRAGAGARLAVELADVADPSVCDAVRDQLAPLARRGIHVRVRCDRDECRHGTPGAAA